MSRENLENSANDFSVFLLIKKRPVYADNARDIMRKLFKVYQTHEVDAFPEMTQRALQKWISEIDNAEMRFVLNGFEEKLRLRMLDPTIDRINDNVYRLLNRNESYQYNGLLKEFIAIGRSDCVDRLVAMGANIDQWIDAEPMLLRLIQESIQKKTTKVLIDTLPSLLPSISLQSHEILFRKLMNQIHLVCETTLVYPLEQSAVSVARECDATPDDALALCLIFLTSGPKNVIQTNFNRLLEKLVQSSSSRSHLLTDIVKVRPDLVDISRLLDRLKRCIAEERNREISHLLDIMIICFNTRAASDAQITLPQSDEELSVEMHGEEPAIEVIHTRFSDTIDVEVADILNALSCSAFYAEFENDGNYPYRAQINALWEKLRIQKISTRPLITNAPEDRYERAIAIFEARYAAALTPIVGKSKLGRRTQFASSKEYLCHIISHGAHSMQAFYHHEEGRRTRKVLEKLGWICGETLTALAPVNYEEMAAFRSLSQATSAESISAQRFRIFGGNNVTGTSEATQISTSASHPR
jgi:hypothetical protein